MATTALGVSNTYRPRGTSVAAIAATAEATAAPDGDSDTFTSDNFPVVRTLVAYDGAVTAATLRLWVKEGGVWYRGASSNDVGALAPTTDGAESRDWAIGSGVEFAFQLESIAPSGGAPTVAVRVQGVSL